MNSMAIIQEQKIIETTVTLSIQKKTEIMVRLAIIRKQKIVETTVRFAISRKDQNYGYSGYNPRAKKSLKQWLHFPFEKKIETMDRLAIIQEQKIVEPTVRFSISREY